MGKAIFKGRDSAGEVQCTLDIEIFFQYFTKNFSITKRFVGSEPFSEMTAKYNSALKQQLPQKGIELIEIPRLETNKTPISASKVRELIKSKETDILKEYLPQTTLDYINRK